MKILFSILFTFLIALLVKTKGQNLIVANYKAQVLYNGTDNILGFGFKNGKKVKYTIISNWGNLTKDSANELYHWQSCEIQKAFVIFYAIDKRTNTKIDSSKFKVKKLPNPIIYEYPSLKKGHLSVDNIQQVWGLHAELPPSNYGARISIVSFRIQIQYKDSTFVDRLNMTGAFDASSRSLINTLKNGDIVTFKDFVVQYECEEKARVLQVQLKYKQGVNKTEELVSGYAPEY